MLSVHSIITFLWLFILYYFILLLMYMQFELIHFRKKYKLEMERKNTIAFQLQINSNTNTSTNPTVMTETEFSHSCVVCLLNPAALCNLTFNSSQWLLRQQWKYLLTKRWLANTQFSTNKASWEFCAHLHRLTTNPGVDCHFLSASAFSFVHWCCFMI